jgi:deoxyribodipyrimidine photo-lyase
LSTADLPAAITIFWFRRDLRLHDNAGLYHALKSRNAVLPLFIFDKHILEALDDKSDKRVHFIHRTLETLQSNLKSIGSGILVKHGYPLEVWKDIISEYPVKEVYVNHDYEPYAIERDEEIRKLLFANGITFHTYKDQVIFEKGEVMKDDGTPYTVWTPYSRRWKEKIVDFYLASYQVEHYTNRFLKTAALTLPSLASIGFSITDAKFPPLSVTDEVIRHYHEQRDYPSANGTTRLSVHLRFGTISIRELVHRARAMNEKFLNELIWREFYQMISGIFPM